MSVDKFGRSSVSLVRRSTPLFPSRQLLQTAGVLCKTGDYVDFKSTFARNLCKPVQSSDAATKEYVDEIESHVRAAAQQSVTDSLNYVIGSVFNRTKDFFNSQLESIKLAFKVFITAEVKRVVSLELDRYNVSLNEFENELLWVKEKMNKQVNEFKRIDDAYNKLLDHVSVLENSGAKVPGAPVIVALPAHTERKPPKSTTKTTTATRKQNKTTLPARKPNKVQTKNK